MQKILTLFKYKVHDSEEKRNSNANNIDCFLCWIYALISLYNALAGVGTMKLFTQIDLSLGIKGIITSSEFETVLRTVLLLLVNMIILFRLNIKLYIKKKEAKEKALMDILYSDYNDVIDIVTETWDRRIQIITYVYLMDIIVILMNIYFKTSIETSLSLIVIIPIIVTLLNNLLDIAENKYSAEAGVLFALEKENLEKILQEGDK